MTERRGRRLSFPLKFVNAAQAGYSYNYKNVCNVKDYYPPLSILLSLTLAIFGNDTHFFQNASFLTSLLLKGAKFRGRYRVALDPVGLVRPRHPSRSKPFGLKRDMAALREGCLRPFDLRQRSVDEIS
jgi:hypothetical protein